MVDRINLTATQIPFSPLRNSSIGFIDDYESGMEASASSMAEEDEIDLEKEDMTQNQQHQFTKKPIITLDHKIAGNRPKSHTSRRRMSSGNSSTDSNATIPPPPTSAATVHTQSTKRHLIPKGEFSSPLNVQSPTSVRLLTRKEDITALSSGYDGDTEGPSVEDNV
ncbi:unnamed protein product [Mucor hiemalis]